MKVSFNPEFFNVINEITSLTDEIKIQQGDDEVIISHQNEKVGVNLIFEQKYFECDQDLAFLDYRTFYAKIKDLTNYTIDNKNGLLTIIDKDSNTTMTQNTSDLDIVNSTTGKSDFVEPLAGFELPKDTLIKIKNLIKLTGVNKADGKPRATFQINSDTINVTFKDDLNPHDTFSKPFSNEIDYDENELVVNVKPLFFEKLPNADYFIDFKNSDGIVAIRATKKGTDGYTLKFLTGFINE
jgi:hypothetical protein